MPSRVARERFKFGDQIEHMLRPGPDVLDDRECVIERKLLRQIPHHQPAPTRHGSGVGFQLIGKDAQEGRFSRAVAAHKPDAVAFVDGERGAIEHNLIVVTNAKVLCGE